MFFNATNYTELGAEYQGCQPQTIRNLVLGIRVHVSINRTSINKIIMSINKSIKASIKISVCEHYNLYGTEI